MRIHLTPGRYPGPFVLPAGLELVGEGEGAVLHGEGEGPVVRAPEGATLKGLGVQGGSWGLEAAGPVRLESVRFSGQRAGAVRMEVGRLTVVGSGFEAGGPEAVGLLLAGGVRAEVREGRFTGAYKRGVEARGAEVALEGVRFDGPGTALYQVEGQVRVLRSAVAGGREPGLSVQRGSLRLEDVTVTGHEFGLQSVEATLETRGFTSVRATRAGLALIGSRGRLEDTVVLGSGSYGGLLLVGSDLELRGVRVDGADAYGIAVTRGKLRLRRAVITHLTTREKDSGDGLHLRDAEVEAEDVVVRDVAGVGVLGAQGSRVVLRNVSLEGCKEAGVQAETLGHVTAVGLEVRGSGGPALMALDDGVLRVEALTVRDNAAGLVWADCRGETKVTLGRVTELGPTQGTLGPEASCVGRAAP
ncbi:hypothetical protein [Archangium sp.]|uniref:hypothetical protein n=1 Tax=Archangium sp. TaxID=1872627 RepID=UPI002EDB4029